MISYPKGVCFYPVDYFDGNEGSNDYIHSWKHLNLVLSSKSIGVPKPKTFSIEIPGSDGSLDLTEYFGEVKYSNRALSFTFSVLFPPSVNNRSELLRDEFYRISRHSSTAYSEYLHMRFSEVQNLLHGKRFSIVLDEDTTHYYVGRALVTECTVNDDFVGQITVECDCEPYKYEKNKVIARTTVDGSETINLLNLRKRVVPVITADAAFTIGFKNSSYSISAGTCSIPDICLTEGGNRLTLTGTGNITFRYRRGEL